MGLVLLGIVACDPSQETADKPDDSDAPAEAAQDNGGLDVLAGKNPFEFLNAIGPISDKLNAAWKQAGGHQFKEGCEIRITVDEQGNITDYSILYCADEATLQKALEIASPVPMPDDPGIADKIDQMKWGLSSDSGSD